MDRNISVQDCIDGRYKYDLFSGYEVDLRYDEDTVFRNLSKNCRRDVRRAERNGLIVEISKDKDFDKIFYNHLKEVFKKTIIKPYLFIAKNIIINKKFSEYK